MVSDKTQYRLSNVIDIIGGGTPRRSVGEFWGGEIPWLSVVDFNSDARFVSNTVDKITELGLTKSSTKLLPKGALIISARGTVGCLAQLQKPMAFNQSCYGLKAKAGILEDDYLYYLVKYKVSDLQKRTHGSVFDTITRDTFEQIIVDIPGNKKERVAISKTLGDLDKKIELNNQTNQTLEKMAQALFKSWFVDFDPVFDNLLASADFKLENLETSLPDELKLKAQRRLAVLDSLENAAECKASLSALAHELKALSQTKEATKDATQSAVQILGKTAETPVKANLNANPNILAQHANTHAHFPNEFEHNEQLGWIPKGWEVLPLESLIILIGGGTPKTSVEEYWNGDIPWFSVVDAPQDSDVYVVDTEKHVTQLGVDKSSTKILRVGTTIISARGTVGKCAFVGTPMAMNQSCYGINGINNISDEFIYYLTRHQVSDLQKRGHGSVFNTITRETFKSILLPFSGDKLTEEYGKAVTSLFDKILMNNRQNIELTKLRDTLLPKLISGELQIPDVATDEEVVD